MGPVLPVGARLTRRAREEPPPGELARTYFDRSATMSDAKRRGSAGMHRRPLPERGASTAQTPERKADHPTPIPLARASGAGRQHRADPGAEGTRGAPDPHPFRLGLPERPAPRRPRSGRDGGRGSPDPTLGSGFYPTPILARASGAGRQHRADPGAEGTGGGATRPPSLLARASGAGRQHRADPGAEGTGGGAPDHHPSWLGLPERGASTAQTPERKGRGYPTIPSLLARASGAGRQHRADPGAEGTGGGATRPPSLGSGFRSGAPAPRRPRSGRDGGRGYPTTIPWLFRSGAPAPRRPRSGRDGGRGHPTTIPLGSGFRSGAPAPRRPRSGRDGGRGYPTPFSLGSGFRSGAPAPRRPRSGRDGGRGYPTDLLSWLGLPEGATRAGFRSGAPAPRRPRSGRDGGRGYPTTIPSGSGFRSGAPAPRRPRSGRDGGRGYPTTSWLGLPERGASTAQTPERKEGTGGGATRPPSLPAREYRVTLSTGCLAVRTPRRPALRRPCRSSPRRQLRPRDPQARP